MRFSLRAAVVALAVFAGTVVGQETHSIHLINKCGHGEPVLVLAPNGPVVATGTGTYMSVGPIHGIAYLQYLEECGPGGEGCTIVDALLNDTGSSVGIKVSAPFAFNAPVGFSYYEGEGHDGYGTFCFDADCDAAGISESVNVIAGAAGIHITFCPA